SSGWRASTVTTTYSAHCPDSVTAALGIHLAVYCAVGACFTFGLYGLLQPARSPNSGLAEYKPPPGAVVTYVKPSVVARGAEPIGTVEESRRLSQSIQSRQRYTRRPNQN